MKEKIMVKVLEIMDLLDVTIPQMQAEYDTESREARLFSDYSSEIESFISELRCHDYGFDGEIDFSDWGHETYKLAKHYMREIENISINPTAYETLFNIIETIDNKFREILDLHYEIMESGK